MLREMCWGTDIYCPRASCRMWAVTPVVDWDRKAGIDVFRGPNSPRLLGQLIYNGSHDDAGLFEAVAGGAVQMSAMLKRSRQPRSRPEADGQL